jgi:hypothetical protein
VRLLGANDEERRRGLGFAGAWFGRAFIGERMGAAPTAPGGGAAGLAGLPWPMGYGGPGWAGAERVRAGRAHGSAQSGR